MSSQKQISMDLFGDDDDGNCYQPQQNEEIVQTPFGRVMIVSLNSQVPEGWRPLELNEGKQIKNQLNQLLSDWSIVAFKTGKLDGQGYGNKFHETYGAECGQLFVVEKAAP